MELRLSHRFDAPLEMVLRVLSSVDYATYLATHHSFFDEIEVLQSEEHHGVIDRVVRYRARPFISRIGVFSLPAAWFAWREHSRFDLTRGTLTFDNVPEVASVRDKLVNRGTMHFRAQTDESGFTTSVRESRFEIAFQVPSAYQAFAELGLTMVGRQLRSSLDEEAGLLAAFLRAPATEVAA